MDSMESSTGWDRFRELAGNRRVKALTIAVLILVTIVLIQVGKLDREESMCDLLANYQLRAVDLHKMQIALSKSGLNEFEVEGNRVLVPKSLHSQYLQAVAEQGAIPQELRSEQKSKPVGNPFLSRSQQLSLQREARKQQVQEMVNRLPFVEQAWFEMDEPESHSSFRQSTKSAVVSIRPAPHCLLLDHHLDAVRQMISGAIADLPTEQVVVIDLNTGFAYRRSGQMSEARQIDRQRTAFAHQQMLETQIRNALAIYSDLGIRVQVEPRWDGQGSIGEARVQESVPTLPANPPAAKLAGANGQVSLESEFSNAQSVDNSDGANQSRNNDGLELCNCKTIVTIDVPYSTLNPPTPSTADENPGRASSHPLNNLPTANSESARFNVLKSEIHARLAPVFHQVSTRSPDSEEFSLEFNLVGAPVHQAAQSNWLQAQQLAQDHWPSLAVLVIGMILIGLVTQSGRQMESPEPQNLDDDRGDILAFSENGLSVEEEPDDAETAEAKMRLSRLIEGDPDSAARVIESWIRDAA